MKKTLLLFVAFLTLTTTQLVAQDVTIEKELTYDQHTLPDTYPYKDGTREFQWDKIKTKLAHTDSLRTHNSGSWGILQNKQNVHGSAPATKINHINEYHSITDNYGVDHSQAIPLYLYDDLKTPERYDYDGALVRIIGVDDKFLVIQTTNFEGTYMVPEKYVHRIDTLPPFIHVIVVDRNNQNISTYEKVGDVWKTRSMNPCTTGAHNPPLQRATPLGLFVIQLKEAKMPFYVDGTTTIAGFAPWASRFCQGAYFHGVPVNLPHTEIVEFSPTLGTTPRSHMCVRNAASHAKFIYDNFPVEKTLVYVIE